MIWIIKSKDFRRAIFSTNIILQISHGDQRKKAENAEPKYSKYPVSHTQEHADEYFCVHAYFMHRIQNYVRGSRTKAT